MSIFHARDPRNSSTGRPFLASVLSARLSFASEGIFVSLDKTKSELKGRDWAEEKSKTFGDRANCKGRDKDPPSIDRMAMLKIMRADDELELTGDLGDAGEPMFALANQDK